VVGGGGVGRLLGRTHAVYGILTVMAEESTTPDLVALTHRSYEASSEGDLDAILALLGPDAVWDMSPTGLGVYEGVAAIRRFFEDWQGSYEEFETEAEKVLDLGNGVIFAVVFQKGRLVGSSSSVSLRYAVVTKWARGLVVRTTNYTDIDEARAAAERLAEERG
jgi:ketosteroid isomerase-like protein